MRVARSCAVVAALGLTAMGLVAPLWAQMGMRSPEFSGIFNPVVGNGAVYEMQGRQQGPKSMEIAVVGKEDYQGQTGYWMEMSFDDPRGGAGVMKMLMVLQGPNPGAKRMIMMMNGRAFEMPMNNPMMGGQMSKQVPHDLRNDKSIVHVGTETITVPAGTYSCEHYRAADGSGDGWVSEKISPWGLVKWVSKDNTMVLTKQITDAKTKITGPITPFNPMEMMQQRPPNQ